MNQKVDELTVRELLAQSLCASHRPNVKWNTLHAPARQLWLYKADKIIKDSGFENAKLVRQGAPLVVADKED